MPIKLPTSKILVLMNAQLLLIDYQVLRAERSTINKRIIEIIVVGVRFNQ